MTSQIQVNLNPQSISQRTHPGGQDISKALSKDGGVDGSPKAGMILSLISIWIHPASKMRPSQAAFLGLYPVEWAPLSET